VSEVDVVGRRPDQAPHRSFLDGFDHDPVARAAAGIAGYAIGLPGGVLRGGWHALEGLSHGLNFVGGLIASPDAREEAWEGAHAATPQ
jgi:hypothetical protein